MSRMKWDQIGERLFETGLDHGVADGHARGDLGGAVALLELGGIGVGLHGGAEVLGGHQVEVLDVVGPDGVGLAAGGGLVDSRQTVPGR